MIDFEALFRISYGLYIVTSGDRQHGNGFISNTVFQVTAEPPRFAAACNKNNFTAGVIAASGAYAVSILHENAAPDLFGRFGYKSGRDFNKMDGVNIVYGETGVPVVTDDCIAFLECRVVQTVDVGTHLLFIGELVRSVLLDDKTDPMTYLNFRRIRKGVSPKNAPTYVDKSKLVSKPETEFKQYRCAACGQIYDEAAEGVKFSDLPADWVCPSCGSEKEDFIEINN